MSAIGPDCWVECVDVSDVPGRTGVTMPLVLHAVYQVAEIALTEYGDALQLRELGWVESVGYDDGVLFRFVGFHPRRFRPIYSPKSSFIEGLKHAAPSDPVPA